MLVVVHTNYTQVISFLEIINLNVLYYLQIAVLIQQSQYGLAVPHFRHGTGVLILLEYHYNKTVPPLTYMEQVLSKVQEVVLLLIVVIQ